MRANTVKVLDCLKRQQQFKVTKKHLEDFLLDAEELGKTQFVNDAINQLQAKQKVLSKKNARPKDRFVDQIKEYQRRTRLKSSEFVEAMIRALQDELPLPIAKSNKGSLAKFLDRARKQVSDQKIKAAAAEILEELV